MPGPVRFWFDFVPLAVRFLIRTFLTAEDAENARNNGHRRRDWGFSAGAELRDQDVRACTWFVLFVLSCEEVDFAIRATLGRRGPGLAGRREGTAHSSVYGFGWLPDRLQMSRSGGPNLLQM